MTKKRDYRHEYDAYQGTPEQIANRSQRNKARAIVEKKVGNLPSTQDVDHKKRIAKGGTNDPGNLHVVDQSTNSAWRKGKKNYG